MELHHLYYVTVLAEEKHFLKAAERLYITQPTLSQQISNLEKELGFSLFTRTTKKVELTPEGAEFAKRARKVIREYEHLNNWAARIQKGSDISLRLGASSITTPHMTGSISDFISKYPSVEIDLVENWDPELLKMVRDWQVDFALSSYPESGFNSSSLRSFPICREYVCAVVSKNSHLAKKESVTLEELEDSNIVTTSKNSGLTRLMMKAFSDKGLSPTFNMTAVSIEARLALVEQGAVTMVLNEQFKHYVEMDVNVIPIEPKIYRTLAVTTQASRKITPLEKELITMIHLGTAKRLGVKPLDLVF